MTENELCEYSKSDKETIANCIGHLIADLECESSLMYGLKPERYYFNTVASYLNDGHTVYDLNNIEDDAEVFNYCE